METLRDRLDLLDYRRRMAALYAEARASGRGAGAWGRWREGRDDLFANHPQTALDSEDLEEFSGLSFFDYDPGWRFEVEVEPVEEEELAVGHSGEGFTAFRRFGQVEFEAAGSTIGLCLYWLHAYGGGVFLPFWDATSGDETYDGGRYLLDSAKGADLGHEGSRIVLDFNYSYHPSCVYSYRWSCPLAPPENHLTVPIRAGERF